jgi:SAM-dependent methyltransferase
MHFWSERMPYLAAFARSHRVLHLGPGREEALGLTVDRNDAVKPSVLADLDKPPYPFRSDSFDAIYAFSVIEHLGRFFDVLTEWHRVVRPGGFLSILTPHFSNDGSFVDPSHRLHLSSRSFDYFIEGEPLFESYGFYSSARFRLRLRLVMIEPPWNLIPGLQRVVNRRTEVYERLFCFLIRGRGLYLELEVVK